MRITIHPDRCIGAGACKEASPAVFDLDDDGFVKLLRDAPGDEFDDGVEEAADNCPGGVIELDGN